MHLTDSGRPVAFVEWPVGGSHCFRRKYRFGGGPDTGGPIGMESSSAGIQFQPRDGDGGMIAQVSAIQPVMDQPLRASCDLLMLPDHLQSMQDLSSESLDSVQKGQLANTLLQFGDLFPVPGCALTGHTDAVEHTIDTGATAPIQCAP